MHKFTVACLAALGLGGFAVAADAQTKPIQNTSDDQPYVIAKLQNQMHSLQEQIQAIQISNGQQPGDSIAMFSAEPLPNHDGAPIPNGDYSAGW